MNGFINEWVCQLMKEFANWWMSLPIYEWVCQLMNELTVRLNRWLDAYIGL